MFAAEGWAAIQNKPFEAKVRRRLCFPLTLVFIFVIERRGDVHWLGTVCYPVYWLYNLATLLPEEGTAFHSADGGGLRI